MFYDSIDNKEDLKDIGFRGDRGVQQNDSTASPRKNRVVMAVTACMAITSADASKSFMPQDVNGEPLDKDNLHYFDAEDFMGPPKPGKVTHLTIDYFLCADGEKGRPTVYTTSNKVNVILSATTDVKSESMAPSNASVKAVKMYGPILAKLKFVKISKLGTGIPPGISSILL